MKKFIASLFIFLLLMPPYQSVFAEKSESNYDEEAFQATVSEFVKAAEDEIDRIREMAAQKITNSNKELDDNLNKNAETISRPISRQQFIAESSLETAQAKINIKNIYNEKAERAIEDTVNVFEGRLRESYIWAENSEKHRALMCYEAIIDKLVSDKYYPISKAAYRKSRVAKEWVEARTAYGR